MSGEKDDRAKVRFVTNAARSKEAVFDKQAVLDKDLLGALEWSAARSAQEVRRARESVICAIERLGEKFVNSGEVDRWFCEADEGVRSVSKCVNGPLFELLAKKAAYEDSECIELFRQGGCLVGELARYTFVFSSLCDCSRCYGGVNWCAGRGWEFHRRILNSSQWTCCCKTEQPRTPNCWQE
jgi:hypothetical protein